MISDDVDSDNKVDIIIGDTSSKQVYIFFNDGNDKGGGSLRLKIGPP